MLFPRPRNPALYTNPLSFGSNLGSDNIWCRIRHLSLAEGSFNDAAFHCPHVTPVGGGICTDSLVNGYTPYELLRSGALTRHHFGYCDLAYGNTVADCTHMSITDSTLANALQLLPSTVQVIFFNDNPGISMLPSNIFSANLKNVSNIQSLSFDECNITTIDPAAFNGLTRLKVLNLNMNNIESLPSNVFTSTPNLLQLSLFTAGTKYYSLTSLPEELFASTPNIERIVMYGHGSLNTFTPNIFKGLTKCTIISFVNCGFNNAGFPTGVFKDLKSLRYFDFFGNKLTSVESTWFDGNWGGNITRVALNDNQISTIAIGAFDSLISLQHAYLHRNNLLNTIDSNLFAKNSKLIHFTLQGP
jgi:Leucine-rich repeat (LRR) protein